MPHRLIVQEGAGQVEVSLQWEGQPVAEPAGPAVPFAPPLTPAEREDLRWYLEDYLEAPYAVYEDRGAAVADALPGWGVRLFDALFGLGLSARDAYQRARTDGRGAQKLHGQSLGCGREPALRNGAADLK
jgi:hypothetical protein